MAERDVPVLIAGGSLVGLSAAMLLGYHGVKSLVVEHHRGTAIHPRAAQVTQRTMEILREVGIERIVRSRSEEQFVQDGAIMAVESLAGRELAFFIANLNEGIRDVSPSERVFISQSLLEPLLKSRAEALGAELRFGTDLVSCEQHEDEVTAVTRDRASGQQQTVRAAYLIAADGAHSGIRSHLGIGMRGRGTFSKSVTIYFHADVAPLLRGRNLSVIYVNHPELRGFIRVEKPFDSGFLAINALGDPAHPQTDVATGLTPERCVDLVRLALGAPDLPVTVDTVMPWNAEATIADRMQDGRIFLAGDAAHVMPPNGGFGGNTGVQDAHNLAWKLALVLNGSAGAPLLSTYEEERRPVGVFTTEQAYSRYVTRTAPYLGTDGIEPVANDLEVELGYVYSSAAICVEPGSPAHEHPRESKGRPGTRAPHHWLDREGERISTLDLFGHPFVLLAAGSGAAWCEAARTVARNAHVDIDVHRIGAGGLLDPERGFEAAYGLDPEGAVIVRPDGFVGWRARSRGAAVVQELQRAFKVLRCLQ
ncbi:MAG TPA: FAD-dependent monooxygenase [Vicinamibacterales bacterium]|nr:FAD-dependent monooxygenase [Vicinamibacterales bacterium]